jgi:hypothetical protein
VPEVQVGMSVDIAKVDKMQHIVFGWGSVTSVNGVEYIDKQEDIITELELESAVYDFMKSPMHDEMHESLVPTSVFVESIIVTDEKLSVMFPEQPLPIGKRGWWVGIKINNEGIFAKHLSGEYTGFSITGTAVRVDA